MQKIIAAIIARAKTHFDQQGGLKTVYFVGCGGSWAASNIGKCYLERENGMNLAIAHVNSNEFVHALPRCIGKNALVFVTSLNATKESVEAILSAKAQGAYTIAITGGEETQMAKNADDFCVYNHHATWTASFHNPAVTLRFAAEIIFQFESQSALYNSLIPAIDQADEIYAKQAMHVAPETIRFAFDNKDKQVFHVFGCGTMYGAAYTTANCYLIEMQQKDAITMHAGEFFHGPFEAITPEHGCILFMGAGSTRALDIRVKTFLEKFCDYLTVIDGAALLGNRFPPEIADYIAPLIAMPIAKLYIAQMAEMRLHPMATRRYMWKFNY